MHSEVRLNQSDTGQSLKDFLDWVTLLLPRDKALYFSNLLTFPLSTVGVVGEIYKILGKVFEGRNPFYKYEFTDSDIEADWEWYRSDVLGMQDYWRALCLQKMRTSINSIVLVDLPAVQEGDRPEAQFIFIDIDKVFDFAYQDDRIQYLMYVTNGEMVVVDDLSYRVYPYNDGIISNSPIIDSPHPLGYCPARFFWTDTLNNNEPWLKLSPISQQLGDLDWYLMFSTGKKHLDMHAAYPIYYGIEQECDYVSKDGEYCYHGMLKDQRGIFLQGNQGIAKCPACGGKRLAGPGSFVEVPAPTQDQPEYKSPIGSLPVDGPSLEYNVKEVERLKDLIISQATGYSGQRSDDQAFNEKQIMASFEGRKSVLMGIKRNIEAIQQWVEETICKLMYGDAYLNASISLGTEWYLFSVDELYDMYGKAKKNGATISQLDMLYEQIIDTEYQNNPDVRERMKILLEIEPLRHMNVQEAIEYHGKGIVSDEDIYLKINFPTLVARFERENISVTEFGVNLEMFRRVDLITKTLLSYGKIPERTAAA
jgi:hypothetical protein